MANLADPPTCDEDPEGFAGEPVPDEWASDPTDGGDDDDRLETGARAGEPA